MPLLLFIVLAVAAPRVVIVLLWFFTHWFQGVFHTMLWPILGFLLLPLTLLWYSAITHWYGGVWNVWSVGGLVICVLLDLQVGRYAAR